MPAWGQSLKPDEVTAVTAYVISLQGTTPATPKAPEGTAADVPHPAGVEEQLNHMSTTNASHPTAPGRVLPTLNEDGSRRWIRPKLSPGGFWRTRRVVAYALMVIFFVIPYLRHQRQAARSCSTCRAGSSPSSATPSCRPTRCCFMLLLMSIAISIFLLHGALRARVVRLGLSADRLHGIPLPPDRAILRGGPERVGGDGQGGQHFQPRRLAKNAVYLLLALFLAHTFLAYFVGVEQLLALGAAVARSSTRRSFLIMAGTTALIFFDFAYFREQTCLSPAPTAGCSRSCSTASRSSSATSRGGANRARSR